MKAGFHRRIGKLRILDFEWVDEEKKEILNFELKRRLPRAKAQSRKGGFPQFMLIFLCALAAFREMVFLKNGKDGFREILQQEKSSTIGDNHPSLAGITRKPNAPKCSTFH